MGRGGTCTLTIFASNKGRPLQETEAGRALHEKVEDAWDRAGLVSSTKKRVSDANAIHELGAWIDGNSQTISISQNGS